MHTKCGVGGGVMNVEPGEDISKPNPPTAVMIGDQNWWRARRKEAWRIGQTKRGEDESGEFYAWRTNLKGTQMDRGMTFKKRYFLRFSIGIITKLSYQNIMIYVMYELMPFYLIQSPSNPTSMRILILYRFPLQASRPSHKYNTVWEYMQPPSPNFNKGYILYIQPFIIP